MTYDFNDILQELVFIAEDISYVIIVDFFERSFIAMDGEHLYGYGCLIFLLICF